MTDASAAGSALVARAERELPDAHSTKTLGCELGRICIPGCVILLSGPLGAGKTTLADGFVAALGAGGATSPTFVLAHRYDGGRLPLWHLDLFRVEDPREIEDLDLAQYISEEGVTLVEWPERVPSETWPSSRIEVALETVGDRRRALLRGIGNGAAVVRQLAARAAPA